MKETHRLNAKSAYVTFRIPLKLDKEGKINQNEDIFYLIDEGEHYSELLVSKNSKEYKYLWKNRIFNVKSKIM